MKKTILLSILLTAATSFAQDKDKVEYNVADIDGVCRDIDSNSQLLVDFMYDLFCLLGRLLVLVG